jgi:hypothetical protein
MSLRAVKKLMTAKPTLEALARLIDEASTVANKRGHIRRCRRLGAILSYYCRAA